MWLISLSSLNRDRSAVHILPSYLKRKASTGKESCKKPKKAKTVKTWDRDILCIPESIQSKGAGGNFSFPRGKLRAQLARSGLIGKLRLMSEMTDEEVAAEIRSVFKGPMKSNPEFPFLYLQPTGGGSKMLTIPSLSSSFKWTAQQVARLSGQSGTIYILAQSELTFRDDIEVNCIIWYTLLT